jgi:hypothetical protein
MSAPPTKPAAGPAALPAAQAVRLDALVDYVPGSVVSRVLHRGPMGLITALRSTRRAA